MCCPTVRKVQGFVLSSETLNFGIHLLAGDACEDRSRPGKKVRPRFQMLTVQYSWLIQQPRELPCGSRTHDMGSRNRSKSRRPRSIIKMQKGFNPGGQQQQWSQTSIAAQRSSSPGGLNNAPAEVRAHLIAMQHGSTPGAPTLAKATPHSPLDPPLASVSVPSESTAHRSLGIPAPPHGRRSMVCR